MSENKKSILIVGHKNDLKLIPPSVALQYFGMKKFISMAKPLEIVPDFDTVITSDVYPTADDYKTFEVVDAVPLIISLEKQGLISFIRTIK